jgi:hypothetical protein
MAALNCWRQGKKGSLPPVEQAKVWALTHLSQKHGYKISTPDIAAAVTLVGGGHPERRAIWKYQTIFKADKEWYPGKHSESAETRGPKRKFTSQMQQATANAAMAIKARRLEPTVDAVKERCPIATTNPETGEAFCDRLILKVFRQKCFDAGAVQPWGHIEPIHKTALSPEAVLSRWNWAIAKRQEGLTAQWFFQNVIYWDPCSTVLSDSLKTGFDEKHASFGKGKRWISPDSRHASRNLRASPYATKQARFGDKRVWWFIVMARGKMQCLVMKDGWTQTGEGMAQAVEMLEPMLRKMCGRHARLPRIILSDRGPGLYQGSSGHIVETYRAAVNTHGFRTFAGEDASKQPADMADFWPHETGVSWLRNYMKKRPLKKGVGIEQMEKDFKVLLQAAADHANAEHEVADLHKAFPTRVLQLVKRKGERLKY